MQANRTMPRTCDHCQAAFLAVPAEVRRGGGRFCKRACFHAHQKTLRREVVTYDDGSVGLPLYARDGSVRAYAIVDATDAEMANQWRWKLSPQGYAVREIGRTRRREFLHHLILGNIIPDGCCGDHINRIKLDCRRDNLRVIPKDGNSQNIGARGGTSQYRGVHVEKRTGRWIATVRHCGQKIHLGTFESECDAAKVAREARGRLMPYAVD